MYESSSDEPHSSRYISVPNALQLISKPFNGNPLELREFIPNVEATYLVAEPSDYSLLLKFVCAKIGGEAKTKLLSRTHLYTWKQVKAVLEENYSIRRTLDYYAHRPFTSKQGQTESISQWDARMDTVCGDLQLAASKHTEDLQWTNEKGEGGGDSIALFVRACFIQGLYDDRIKTMVKATENVNTPMAQLVEVTLEEESGIKSEIFRKNIPDKGQFGHQGIRNMLAVFIEDNKDNISSEITPRTWKVNQVDDKICHQVQQITIANNQEDYSSCHMHPVYNLSSHLRGQEVHSPFVIYVLCDQLKNGMENALIDTGSQVSLQFVVSRKLIVNNLKLFQGS